MSASKPTPMRRRRRASKAKLVTAAPAAEALAVDPEDGEEEADDLPTAAALEVDIPPAEPEQTSFLDRAKSALGFGPEKDVEPKPRAGTGRLNKHQQQLYDMAAPLATEIGISLGAFAWEKAAGSDYRVLAPSDEVAAKIMQPLTRIAARHIQLHGKASPDALDLSASLFAMVGYMWSSVRLYQEF